MFELSQAIILIVIFALYLSDRHWVRDRLERIYLAQQHQMERESQREAQRREQEALDRFNATRAR
jgi:hypothetical protein